MWRKLDVPADAPEEERWERPGRRGSSYEDF
jgi:hypothetical protein